MSHVIAVRLSDAEHECFLTLCVKNRVSRQQFLHAVVIDVLVEEGFDALRCRESEGCERTTEESEARGSATP